MSSCLESRNDARLHSIALDSLCNPLCHLEGAYLAAFYHANREVVATYEYDSWGNVLKSDVKGIAADNPFGYAGYMYDKEIGMYYLIARYYNPEHGVFLSVDPDPGDEDDPITMNGYTYGDNNPVMMVDPDGYKAKKVVSGYKYWKKGKHEYYQRSYKQTKFNYYSGQIARAVVSFNAGNVVKNIGLKYIKAPSRQKSLEIVGG
ncbi:hypothetical protein bcgnr5394_09060 [Bacillus cereus]|nr:RHS repeat-associated core domain-containing protein [Bacillus sp. BNPI-92]AQQ61906.1 tRNA(Glu)-specific nuclease WapA [Bacillus cereus]KZD79772.1 Cell wall-associated protein [Bacillus cereus]SME48864.1 tRNA(Glu)-specific nuclease WapA precursor [Bacillus cereus]BCC57819.1 hypothetical protein BCJMU10_1127 [Bacillus cereus]BCT41476.1 hypothetical protein WHT_c12420 [Bacillus cereus]